LYRVTATLRASVVAAYDPGAAAIRTQLAVRVETSAGGERKQVFGILVASLGLSRHKDSAAGCCGVNVSPLLAALAATTAVVKQACARTIGAQAAGSRIKFSDIGGSHLKSW